MLSNYKDILELTDKEPLWYDFNGTPRFAEFHPDLCPNIYTNTVFLLYIQCQACGKGFHVEMHYEILGYQPKHPKHLHYGDPPIHDCIGDTMNCDDIEIYQAWHRKPMSKDYDGGWERVPELEILMCSPYADEEETE